MLCESSALEMQLLSQAVSVEHKHVDLLVLTWDGKPAWVIVAYGDSGLQPCLPLPCPG